MLRSAAVLFPVILLLYFLSFSTFLFHPSISLLLLLLLPASLSPSPSCAVGSSEWRSSGSSGSVNQEENIATRGRVNKACYLATPLTSPWELEANGRRHWLRPPLARCSGYVMLQRQDRSEKRCLCSFCSSLDKKAIPFTLVSDPAISQYTFLNKQREETIALQTEKE